MIPIKSYFYFWSNIFFQEIFFEKLVKISMNESSFLGNL